VTGFVEFRLTALSLDMPGTVSQLLVRGRRIEEDSKSTIHTVIDWLRIASAGRPDSKFKKDLDRNARLLDIADRSITREEKELAIDVKRRHGKMGNEIVEAAQKRLDGDEMEE
jgi:hypothetical protein